MVKKRAMTEEAKALKAEFILGKTEALFMASDYDSVKIVDIAKASDISTGIVFSYFKNKETLFFTLLIREMIKRLDRFQEKINKSTIENYDDFKQVFLEDIKETADDGSLYMRLEIMRTSIFEKNADADVVFKLKKQLHVKFEEMAEVLSSSQLFNKDEIKDIYFAESAILAGSLHMAMMPESVIIKLKEFEYNDFIRSFSDDAYQSMSRYLDGFWYQKQSS